MVQRRFVAFLVVVLLARAGPVAALDWMKIQGRQVVSEADGKPVRLRGVCLDRFYFSYAEDPGVVATYCGREDIVRLAAAGVTLVRLGFHPQEVLGPTAERSLVRLDEIVGWCRDAAIHVVLDLRVPPGNDDIDPIDGAFWDDPEHAEAIVRLWRTVAARYAKEPAVLGYDVFNEPTPPEAARWWELADRLIAAVRSVDPRHIVVIEPPLLEGESWHKVADPQVLYSVHFYEPLLLSHQGADWLGDLPLPMDVEYPGVAPVAEEAGTADGPHLDEEAAQWRRVVSEEAIAPDGADWLAVILYATGDVQRVWFDDLELTENGTAVAIPNGGFEEAGERDAERPRLWRPDAEGDGKAVWSGEAHGGEKCLRLDGVTKESSWTNWHDAVPGYYAAIAGGKRYRLAFWVKTKGNRGGVGATLAWLKRGGERWDRARLEKELQPVLDWGKRNGVPLYFGEVGATRGNRRTQAAYVTDVTAILNAAEVPWTLWTFRDPSREARAGAFGLYFGPDQGATAGCTLNRELWDTLRAALK